MASGVGQAEGEPQTLTGKTLHGLKWSYASTIANSLLQIVVTAVLARLLTPQAYGVVAMGNLVVKFGQYFAQLGLSQAVVQSPEVNDDDVQTAFGLAMLTSLVTFAVILAAAPLVQVLFPGTPGAVKITRVMALTFPLAGFSLASQGLLRRRFAFRWIACVEIGSYVLGYAGVTIALALAGKGPWSLVGGMLASSALGSAAYYAGVRHSLRPRLARDSLRRLFGFGGRVSIIGFLEFLGGSLDTLWAGHSLGAAALGLYTRATNLVNVPAYYLTSSFSRVLLPSFSRVQRETERLRGAYLSAMTVFAALTMPFAWGIAAASREVIFVLLGSQWTAAVPVLAVLAIGVPFTMLTTFGGILCEATATLNEKVLINVVRLGVLATLLGLLAPHGIVGIATAFVISEAVVHVMYFTVVRRLVGLTSHELISAYVIGVASGLVVVGVVCGVRWGLESAGWPVWATLVVEIAAAFPAWAVVVVKARHGLVWREVRLRLRNAQIDVDGMRCVGSVVAWMDARAGA